MAITAQLPLGEFLSEAVLAQKCKTSRTPVREACARLARDKWLSLIPRKDYLVKPISVRPIVELYESRKLLECFSAEKVTQEAPEHGRHGPPIRSSLDAAADVLA